MEKLLESLLAAILPILLKEADKLLGYHSSSSSHEWVIGLVDDICKIFDSKLPGFMKPSEEELKILIEDAIKKLLDKL